MAVPLNLQLFDAFLGDQQGIHSVILPDIFSSGGAKNVYIDKFARVAQILGYAKMNAAAMTTDTGASAARVRGLIPYRKTSGGSITRKLLIALDDGANEWELWVSADNGITASFLYDAGAGSVGTVPDAAQFGDNLYVCNGKVVPRVYNGTSIAAAGLTQSPTPTLAASALSGHCTGNYKVKLVSTVAGVRQNGSVASNSILANGKQLDVTWTADTNVLVDGYEAYLTTGTGTTYYYATSIVGRTTAAVTLNISDATLLENRILEEHGDAPPTCYFCEPHKQRMWWLRTDANPTIGYWSDPGSPESVYGENYLKFSDSETVGDEITGALGNFEGLFVVGTEKAIWTVSGTGAVIGDIVDWTKTRTNAATGWVSSRSAVRIPAGSKYTDQSGGRQTTTVSSIAYFTPLGDIRVFDGDNDLIVSHPVRDTVKAFNYAHRKKIYAVIDSYNDQAVWFFPSGSDTEPGTAVAWNYRYGVWYTWTPMPFGHVVELDTTASAAMLLAGEVSLAKGAFVYQFLSGSSFDGNNIESMWMTKTLYGTNKEGQAALSNAKRWRWVDVLFRIDASVSITIEWLPGGAPDNANAIASVIATPQADFLVSADGSTIVTADGSDILLSAQSAQVKALLEDLHGRYLVDEGLRLRFKTNGIVGGWALEAFELAYQILPGLKRRDQ